jgi:hypothetical protein
MFVITSKAYPKNGVKFSLKVPPARERSGMKHNLAKKPATRLAHIQRVLS